MKYDACSTFYEFAGRLETACEISTTVLKLHPILQRSKIFKKKHREINTILSHKNLVMSPFIQEIPVFFLNRSLFYNLKIHQP